MKILITGGAGFIGSHTVEAALAAGHTPIVFDDLSGGRRANVPADVELLIGDVRNYDQVRAAVVRCEAVLHLAAQVSVPQSLSMPAETLAINTLGSANVVEAARAAGIRRVVLASTSSVYGDQPGWQDEHTPVGPISPYGAAKLMAEQWLQVYAHAYDMHTVILRYFNVYGPRQAADSDYSGVLALWCAAAKARKTLLVYGDGEQTRDFVHVRDVAQANLLAVTSDRCQPGGVYPVATGEDVSLNVILKTLDWAVGTPVKRKYLVARPGDIRYSVGDSTRLRGLGWAPQVALGAGLAELLG